MRKTKEILVVILMLTMVLALAKFSFAADKQTYTANGIKWEYELEEDCVVNLVCKNVAEVSGKVEIPATINGKKVTKLGNSAFQKCYGLTEITFPSTIVYIGYNAFNDCSGLKTVTLPDSLTAMDDGAFGDCSGLKTVNLSKKLTKISDSVFRNCTGLKTIVLPDSITTLEYGAFSYTKGLNSILIPENVSSIANGAFINGNSSMTIYGVKGSTAEEFANKNKYNFDVIANYNPDGSVAIAGPKVTEIWVVDPKAGTYNAPQTVKVIAKFSEAIKGTAPNLRIKFGTGSVKTVDNGTVNNTAKSFGNTTATNYVLWSYNIQNDDEGQLQIVSIDGGTLTGNSGVAATITTPETKGYAVVANKTGTVTNNTENKDKTTDTTKTDTTNTAASTEKETTTIQNSEMKLSNNITIVRKDNSTTTTYYVNGLTKPLYYYTITNDGTKAPEFDKKFRTIFYSDKSKTYTLDQYYIDYWLSLNKTSYIWIYEGDTKASIGGGKLERTYPYYKDGRFFTATFVSQEKAQIIYDCHNIAVASQIAQDCIGENDIERKMNVKIGKIADNKILASLKNGDSNAWNNLLDYSKNANAVLKTTLVTNSNYGYSGNSLNIDTSKLEDKAFYFLYVELDTENGKYYPAEGVTLGRISTYENNKKYFLHFYGSKDFNWGEIAAQVTPTNTVKNDNTVATTILPNTGKDIIIYIAIIATAIIVIAVFIKNREYRDIK